MSNFPYAGTILFSAKDAVRLYVNPAQNSTKSDEVFDSGQQIGVVTGNHVSNSQGDWFSINVVVSKREVSKWINVIPGVGQTIYFGSKAVNLGTKTSDFWMRVSDGDYQIIETSGTDALQVAKDAADLKAKQKQDLIDAVDEGGKNPNLTANGGAGASNTSIYWIVGGVLVLIVALVVWKVASKPKAVAPAPAYVPDSSIPKPAKLR